MKKNKLCKYSNNKVQEKSAFSPKKSCIYEHSQKNKQAKK
jgi:hypothetical protein